MIVTNFLFLQATKTMIPTIFFFFVNVRMLGLTNSTWILIVTIQEIEQNQMQDMKKIGFSSQKNNIFYYVSLEDLLFEKQKKIVLVQIK